jgi:hypothetical protein
MANVRISDLPLANLPLAGTEVAVVVQDGITVKVPVTSDNLGFTNGFTNLVLVTELPEVWEVGTIYLKPV